jgi:hypothetical protein
MKTPKNLNRYPIFDTLHERMSKASLWIFIGLLIYMPLHIFLSTWFGTTFKLLDFAKVAKDIVMVIGFALVCLAAIDKKWIKSLASDKLAWLAGGYILLTLLMAALFATDPDAEVLGIVYNLRFLVFFVYAVLLTRRYKPAWLQKNALRAVLGTGLIVMAFGFAQYMWLPDDALARFGYSRDNGVLPVFLIDEKPDLERIMSTLRDPNSLGSYLIIILSISLVYLLKTQNRDLKRIYAGLLALSIICLWFTFSRSAWLGTVVAVGTIALILNKQRFKPRLNPRLALLIICLVMLLVGGVYAFRDSYFVKNVILHADESTVLEDPNELRIRFWTESIEAGIDRPLGYGPGTAGLASIRNDIQGTVLNENYYLQILHEVGIVGLVLFLSILGLVGYRLYLLTDQNILAISLLAAFVGLALTNFLVHIWANEAVAYTWWGLAGLVIYGASADKTDQPKKLGKQSKKSHKVI